MEKPKILIVDDEPQVRAAMARALGATYACLVAADVDQALALFAANPDTAAVLTDYKMPGANGMDLIRRVKAQDPSVGCILITAFSDVPLAVEAMRDGADDFIPKPITDLAALERRIEKAVRTCAVQRAPEPAESVPPAPAPRKASEGLARFTGESPAMARVYALIRRVAPSTANVFIEGPSGTGKELVAHAIHDLSPRAKGPFVAVECAALSPSLIESELFGYEAKSFTGASDKGKIGRFEAADGGTLFMDEITEIDLATQVKLLRVLESRTIQRVGGNADIPCDFRLVAATNRNLAEYVAAGKFREDLYYRLNVIDIRLPALRDRPGDVALLAHRFLGEFAAANGNRVKEIGADALAVLADYAWPGNVRQLRNVIEKMVVLAEGPVLTAYDVPAEIRRPAAPAPAAVHAPGAATALPAAMPAPAPAPASLADAEKEQILRALEATRGNKSKAAEMLGISRRTILRKMKEWNA